MTAHLRGRRRDQLRTYSDFALAPRELEKLRFIATGVSNATIAEQLNLAINSIKTYIRTAYRRIGVERRSQAVAWCYQYDLFESRQDLGPPGTPLVRLVPGLPDRV